VARGVLIATGMLRSIIAIWTIAIGLIIVAANLGCGGCANGVDDCCVGSECGGVGPDMAGAGVGGCGAASCAACAADESCFFGSATSQTPTFCAHRCLSDDDCTGGAICAQLFASLQPAVCVTHELPIGCGSPTPSWHCYLGPQKCYDAKTLMKPFSWSDSRTCGYEFVHCANGCDADNCR